VYFILPPTGTSMACPHYIKQIVNNNKIGGQYEK